MRIVRAPAMWTVLVLVALVGFAGSASAQGLELGPFRLLPSLGLSVEYDDNILLTGTDKIDDFIFHITPGILLELPSRKYAVRLGYQADVLQYVENTDLNTVHHAFLADGRVNLNMGLGLRLTDRFLITDEFAGFPVPELTQRVDRWENALDAGMDYTIRERFTVDVGYRWFMVDYRDPDFDQFDRDDHTITGTLFYRVLPKTSVLGEVEYNMVRYDEPSVAVDRDSDAWRFKVGLKGDITAKTTILLKVGWEWRDYENRQDWDGLIAELNVIWKYRDPSEVRLFAGRQNVESLFEGTNYYISTYGGAEVRHFLSERLTLRVRGLGGVNEYPEDASLGAGSADRRDVFFEGGAALKYQMRRWLAFELAYGFLKLDSNFDEFDYTDNRIKASVIFSY